MTCIQADDFNSVISTLSGGNQGAADILAKLFELVDLLRFANSGLEGSYEVAQHFDTLKIDGRRVCMLYNFCREDVAVVYAVLLAHKNGLLQIELLNHAIDHQGEGIDLKAVSDSVIALFPTFK